MFALTKHRVSGGIQQFPVNSPRLIMLNNNNIIVSTTTLRMNTPQITRTFTNILYVRYSMHESPIERSPPRLLCCIACISFGYWLLWRCKHSTHKHMKCTCCARAERVTNDALAGVFTCVSNVGLCACALCLVYIINDMHVHTSRALPFNITCSLLNVYGARRSSVRFTL